MTSAVDAARRSWRVWTKRISDWRPRAVSRWSVWLGEPRQIHVGGLLLKPRFSLRLIALISGLVLVACALIPTAVSALLPKVYGGEVEFVLKPRPELSDSAAERVMLTEEVISTSPSFSARLHPGRPLDGRARVTGHDHPGRAQQRLAAHGCGS